MAVATTLVVLTCSVARESVAAPIARAPAAVARATNAAQNCLAYHAGNIEGDGEYSDGAMLSARGITCRRAFGLVRPRYGRVLSRERDISLNGQLPHFRLGLFRCHFTPSGPDTLKTCVSPRARFTFL